MADLRQIAMQALQRNPQVANSPQGRQFMQILQSGDVAAGQQMAQNMCQAYGVSEQDAIKQVAQHFNIPM